VVSEPYFPEETPTGYIMTKIAEGLAEHYPVKVLCSQPTYDLRGMTAPWRETHHGVAIRRCVGTTFNKDRLLLRLINILTLSISIFVSALFQFKRRDCVLVVTNPPLLPFVTALACRLRRAKCLLLIHDVYPEVLLVTRLVGEKSIIVRLINYLTCRLYQNVNCVIVLGHDVEKLVLGKMGKVRRPIAVIPNWGDVDQVAPLSRADNALLHELNLTSKFVLQYSGNMGRTHGLECLLESAILLKDNPLFHFLFLGSGAKKDWLVAKVKDHQLPNVTVLPGCMREKLAEALNACDVAIISFIPGMAGISVPSRLYNVMAAGKPIIAVTDPDSELAVVVREEQIGWVVPPDQPAKIVDAILEAQSDRVQRADMSHRARRAAVTKYSFQHAIGAYFTLVRDLIDDSESKV
jgi:glycosyltransferase involved in cell wall biosynthesis